MYQVHCVNCLIEYVCYVHARTSGIAGVLIADAEYNSRVAFTLLSNVLLDYENTFNGKWSDSQYKDDFCIKYDRLNEFLKKYQDPKEADELMKIKKDLDDTKTIMVLTN